MAPKKKIAVIGCGIIGLTSAHLLQETLVNCDITIFADRFTPNTTSDGAAGLCLPTPLADNPTERMRVWIKRSIDHIRHTLKYNPQSGLMGFSQATGYYLSFDTEPEFYPEYVDLAQGLQRMSAKELEQFPEDVRGGFSVTVQFIESKKYLPFLMKEFVSRGGKIIQKKIANIQSLYKEFDVIINCAGLGAQDLADDNTMFPVTGHVVRMKAPWIQQFIFYDKKSCQKVPNLPFVFPNQDNIVVGVVNTRNSTDQQPKPENRKKILENASKYIPSLKNAEFIEDWVGIRPGRDTIRLEKMIKMVKFENAESAKRVVVIHNYGHYNKGVCLSRGCAEDVVQLICEEFKTKSKL